MGEFLFGGSGSVGGVGSVSGIGGVSFHLYVISEVRVEVGVGEVGEETKVVHLAGRSTNE